MSNKFFRSTFKLNIVLLFALLLALMAVSGLIASILRSFSFSPPPSSSLPIQDLKSPSIPTPSPTLTPFPTPIKIQTVIINAPFVSQAPFGQWSDSRFQDGCEETSSLIAYSWAHNLPLSATIAQDTIVNLAQFQLDNFNSYVDTSTEDTADRILKGYFKLKKVEIISPKSWEDLIKILLKNKIIIAPMNGQLLANPNFTPPGPERHMLVISGFDVDSQQFITQDPGTRNGRNFQYSQKNLWDSLRDYPTGDHAPITNPKIKKVIAISPEDN